MMKHFVFLVCTLGLAACAGSQASRPTAQSAETFMWAYTKAWNSHDTTKLSTSFWATTPSIEEEKIRLDSTFSRLLEQGYDKSTIHEIKTCATGAVTAWGGMKFTRLKTDGSLLGPAIQASAYDLEWTDKLGWRIKTLKGAGDPTLPLTCPN